MYPHATSSDPFLIHELFIQAHLKATSSLIKFICFHFHLSKYFSTLWFDGVTGAMAGWRWLPWPLGSEDARESWRDQQMETVVWGEGVERGNSATVDAVCR